MKITRLPGIAAARECVIAFMGDPRSKPCVPNVDKEDGISQPI